MENLATAVQTAVQYVINDLDSGTSQFNLHGLSIFFPKNQNLVSNLTYSMNNNVFQSTNWLQMLHSYFSVVSNSSYLFFKKSNPIQKLPSNSISIHLDHSQSNVFLDSIVSGPVLFNFSLYSPQIIANGGVLLIYELRAGGRLGVSPNAIIDIPSFNKAFYGSFIYNFSHTGLMYLRVSFIPSGSQITYGSSPYVSFSRTFVIPDKSSYILPVNLGSFKSAFVSPEPTTLQFSLANTGKQPYTGGTLKVLIFNQSTNTYTIIKTISVGAIQQMHLANYSLSLSSLTQPGTYHFSLILDDVTIFSSTKNDFQLLPDYFDIINPDQQLSSKILFNGKFSYQINQFFTFDATNSNLSIMFSLPSNPAGLGDFQFSFSVKNQLNT